MASNPNQDPAPGMLASHAQYAKGYVSETIGNVTGSQEWTESGKADQKEGVEGMRAANKANPSDPAPSSIGGKIEKAAGTAVGCEGMEKEGAERETKAKP